MTGHFPILSLLLWLPVLGGCLVLLAGRIAPQTVRWLSLFVAVLVFAVSVPLWTQFDPTTVVVRPLASLDRAARSAVRANGIAYVFQGANLLPHFTAFENISFAAQLAGGSGIAPDDLLRLVGLSASADNLPAELSGGEAQRVAIARALAQQPELMLCDEPTGHLDSDTGERVLDLIDALQREFGFALVVATHDADVAARLDRAVELEDGTILSEESG